MTTKRNIFVCDMSGTDIVLAYVSASRGKSEVLRLAAYDQKGLNEAQISEKLRAFLSETQMQKPLVYGVVGLHQTITRNLEIPSLDPKEIKEIIDLQAGRQTPYSRDEIVMDYTSLGAFRNSYTRVMLVIIHRTVINRIMTVFSLVGMTPDLLLFGPEAVGAECNMQMKIVAKKHPVAIVHIDTNFTDVIIEHSGMSIFMRNLPIGPRGNEEALFNVKLAQELSKSLEAYQAEEVGPPVRQLLLMGSGEVPDSTANVLQDMLQLTVQPVEYFSWFSLQAQARGIPNMVKHCSFLNVLAAADLGASGNKINLLPDDIKLKRRFEDHTRELMKTAILSVGVLLIMAIFLMSRVYLKAVVLERLHNELDIRTAQAAVLEKSFQRLRTIKYHLRNRGKALRVLTTVFDLLPKRIFLTDIKMDAQGKLTLKGTARAMSDVFAFVATLEQENLFTAVKTNFTTARKQDGEDWADFGITCAIRNDAFDVKEQ